jgi:hypothetical protein
MVLLYLFIKSIFASTKKGTGGGGKKMSDLMGDKSKSYRLQE